MTALTLTPYSGSIPASAGQPSNHRGGHHDAGVYPRECGAANSTLMPAAINWGLSPRVRGSHSSILYVTHNVWSIPASAGQPVAGAAAPMRSRVYPRECGAASAQDPRLRHPRGLSPRVRGSLACTSSQSSPCGSIPASAGQPDEPDPSADPQTVYPRECGAAHSVPAANPSYGGLSPRVRGSQRSGPSEDCALRSIPASAGQPPRNRAPRRRVKVYPRECGAAQTAGRFGLPHTGLSPRVRGSRQRSRGRGFLHGSIPASAGQPVQVRATNGQGEVYPRECGAAR